MDRMASIELALKNESTEMQFYLNEAKRSKNEVARTMFQQLARDEEEHMTRIKGLHEKLIGSGSWPKDVPIEVAGTDVNATLNKLLSKSTKETSKHDDDDIAALKKAQAFEAKGEELYRNLAQACENPMERNFFTFLAKIEREHHLSVTDALAYLEDPEDWLMRNEKAGLDGA